MDLIRVAIVEDDRITRQGLAELVVSCPDFTLAGTSRRVEDALAGEITNPDVLLLDIQLPGMPGTRGVSEFLLRRPQLRIVMLTVFDDSEHIFDAVCAGACGYLLKHTEPARLLQFIREAAAGGAPMTPSIARRMLDLFRETAPKPSRGNPLTEKETEVVALLAEGHSYESIASLLDITGNTVRNHIRSIYDKLHVHSASEAVSKALRRRLIR